MLHKRVLLFFQLLPLFTTHNAADTVLSTLCFGGQDVFTAIRENSPGGTLVARLSMTGDPETNEISLELAGDNADWLYLEGKTIKLNTTLNQDLDREIYGSLLKAYVSCYVNDTLQSEYGVVVEVVNENDNEPVFLWNTTQAKNISELAAVDTVIFALQASDADGDTIMYEIDESSPDAENFRIDLPNSGQVLLNKPLDYEKQIELHLRVYAVEMNTKEQLNATATLVVYVQDGDDHYPQFLPCTVLPLIGGAHVCANPVYTTNITERDQDIVLDFYPGPVNAVDGDKALNTPLIYSILSGADNGRFLINGTTGEITLTRPVENRLLTPSLRLRIMAAQVDDLKKYSVATAIVRVVAENRFPPQFQRREYRAFLTETTSQATFVLTYGNELLVLQATDQDFPDGMNPQIQYSLARDSELFSLTKEGFLIARGNQPPPPHTHQLEVLATDLESGDVANASVTVTILHRGQPVPHSPLSEDPHYGQGSPGRAVGVLGLCLLLLGALVCAVVRWHRRRKRRQDQSDRGYLAEEKDPNVSLKWFQLVNHSCPMVLLDEVSLHSEVLCSVDTTQSPLDGKPGIYTVTEKLSSSSPSPATTAPASSAIRANGNPSDKALAKSVSFRDEVTIRTRETEDEEEEQEEKEGVDTYPDKFVVDMNPLLAPVESTTEEKHEVEHPDLPLSELSKSDPTVSSESSLVSQEQPTKSEYKTNSDDMKPEADARHNQSITEKCPPEQSQHDTPTSHETQQDDQTLEKSKSDRPKDDGSSLAKGEEEPNTAPTTHQDASPHMSPERVSSKQENADTQTETHSPQTHTDRKEESKADQQTTNDPQQSQSHTDNTLGQTPHTENAKGNVNDQEIQLEDLEKVCTEIPESSSNAVMLDGQSTQSPEVHQTHTSTHSHENTPTQPPAPSTPTPQPHETQSSTPTRGKTFIKPSQPTEGPSSEPKATDTGSHNNASTLAPTQTSSEQTDTDVSKGSAEAATATPTSSQQKATDASSEDGANTAAATHTSQADAGQDAAAHKGPQGSNSTEATGAGAEEADNTDTNTPVLATNASEDRNVPALPMPNIIITGSGDMEKKEEEEEVEKDNIEEKLTKVTNLDDDVTDTPSKDGPCTD